MTSLPILLPEGYTAIVSVGDSVKAKQVLAEKSGTDETVVISIADELSIKPQHAGKTIKKNPGDTIEPGDIVAAKKGFLGMGEQKVISSVSGKIVGYDRRTGELSIQIGNGESGDTLSLYSPVDGKVTVCDNEKIVVETEKDAFVPLVGFGQHARGELFVISSKENEPLPLHALTPDCIQKILMTPSLDRDGLIKAIGMDTSGIILHTITDEDQAYFEEKGATVPILVVSADDYKKIAKWSGKELFVDADKKSIVLLHV